MRPWTKKEARAIRTVADEALVEYRAGGRRDARWWVLSLALRDLEWFGGSLERWFLTRWRVHRGAA